MCLKGEVARTALLRLGEVRQVDCVQVVLGGCFELPLLQQLLRLGLLALHFEPDALDVLMRNRRKSLLVLQQVLVRRHVRFSGARQMFLAFHGLKVLRPVIQIDGVLVGVFESGSGRILLCLVVLFGHLSIGFLGVIEEAGAVSGVRFNEVLVVVDEGRLRYLSVVLGRGVGVGVARLEHLHVNVVAVHFQGFWPVLLHRRMLVEVLSRLRTQPNLCQLSALRPLQFLRMKLLRNFLTLFLLKSLGRLSVVCSWDTKLGPKDG